MRHIIKSAHHCLCEILILVGGKYEFLTALARTSWRYGRSPAIFDERAHSLRNDISELDADPSDHRRYLDCLQQSYK